MQNNTSEMSAVMDEIFTYKGNDNTNYNIITGNDTSENNMMENITSDCDMIYNINDNDIHNQNETKNIDVTDLLAMIQNKYSNNAEQKHLNQLYDIGILTVNHPFNYDKLIQKLTKIIDERSYDPVKKIREAKRVSLINAFKQGIQDASTDEYRNAYDGLNRYRFNAECLKKKGHIDSVLDHFIRK